jgi:hypothetical protein
MSHPDEGTIHAWLDGELTAPESAKLELRLTVDPEFAAAVAEARGLIAASSRIIGALDAVPGNVIPEVESAPARLKDTAELPEITEFAPSEPSEPSEPPVVSGVGLGRGGRRFHVKPWMGVAAALVLTVGTAVVAWPPTVMDDATLRESAPPSTSTSATVQARDISVSPQGAGAPRSERTAPDPVVRTPGVAAARPQAADTRAGDVTPPPPVPREATPTPAAELGRTADPFRASDAGAAEERRALADDAELRTQRQRQALMDSGLLNNVVVTGTRGREEKASAPASASGAASAPPPPSTAAAAPARAAVATQALVAPAPTTAPSNDALAGVGPLPFLAGCWRVVPPLAADTVMRNPTILARRGDTLVLALTPQRAVAVLVRGDTLRTIAQGGDTLDRATERSDSPISGVAARREDCPPAP